MNANEEKQLGSNLTGAAIPAKPGHQRDIAIENYTSEEKNEDKAEGDEKVRTHPHVENTDALLGDVHPTRRTSESQEDQNASQE